MKRKACFFLTILFSSLRLTAQDVTTAGIAAEPVTIDGKANEWSVPFRFSDYTSKLQYNIKNDSSTLYFCFKTDDRLAQMKLLHFGFDVYIDTTGKKKKTQHLQFPMKYERNHDEESQGTTLYELQQRQLRMKSETNTLLAENFIGLEKGVYPINMPGGIRAAIDFDSLGALVYEIAVPLKFIQVKENSEKTPWYITFRLNAPHASNLNMGTGGETLNQNRDGRGGGGLGTGSVMTPDMDGGLDGSGGTGGFGGGMGGVGANTQAGLYGSAYGANNNLDANIAMMKQPIGVQSKVYEASEWKFKFRLAK